MLFAGCVCHNVKAFVCINTPKRAVVIFMHTAILVDR